MSVICAAIILWAFWEFRRLQRALDSIKLQLKQACDLITQYTSEKEFALNFQEFQTQIEQLSILKHAWNEFSETLLPSVDEEPLVVYNTRSAAAFFHQEVILGTRINLRFYNAFPNFLTGAGILGTFIGLVAGIYLASHGLASSDVIQAKQALQNLLHGASLAFWTSIAGIFCSILFSWREKHELHEIDNFRSIFIDRLDSLLHRVLPEQISLNSYKELQQIRLISANNQEELEQQSEVLTQFTTELAFQIAQAFDEKVTQPMGPLFERLITAVEDLKNQSRDANDELIKEVVAKFQSAITGAAGQEMTAFAGALRELTEKLEITLSELIKRQQNIQNDTEKTVNSITNAIVQSIEFLDSKLSDTVQTITDQLSDSVGNMISQIQDATRKAASSLNETALSFKESVHGITMTLNEIKDITNEAHNLISVEQDLFEKMNEIQAAIETITEKIGTIGHDLVKASETNREASLKGLEIVEGMQRAIESVW